MEQLVKAHFLDFSRNCQLLPQEAVPADTSINPTWEDVPHLTFAKEGGGSGSRAVLAVVFRPAAAVCGNASSQVSTPKT